MLKVKVTHFFNSYSPTLEYMKKQLRDSGIWEKVLMNTVMMDYSPEILHEKKVHIDEDTNHVLVFEDEDGVFLVLEGVFTSDVIKQVLDAIDDIWNE